EEGDGGGEGKREISFPLTVDLQNEGEEGRRIALGRPKRQERKEIFQCPSFLLAKKEWMYYNRDI
ncbi:MAG: hypothetical protein J6W28_06285, partial [Clostridia bacterium]|nr:hypothetical protein [Clostridia bacterium]